MWGTDYPHPEGTWPNTVERLATDFRAVPVEDTRLLLGLNAVALLRPRPRRPRARSPPTSARRPSSSTRTSTCAPRPNAIREARFWFDDYGIEWKG